MALALQVPNQPANGPDVFSFTLVQQGTTRQYTLKKRLAENTIADLRVLAKKVGLSGHGHLKKAQLARELQGHVFFNTHEEAVTKYPILAEPIATTEAGLTDQRNRVGALIGTEDHIFFAHLCKKFGEICAAERAAMWEAIYAKKRAKERRPAWWDAGDFEPAGRWQDTMDGPHLKVVVEVTERDHDGWCSSIDGDEEEGFHTWGHELEITETTETYIGCLPLKDEKGAAWDFLCQDFDPGWRCASGGSGVCGVRPSVRFVSMERIE